MAASSNAVFLSYASQDADAARKLCDVLRSAGVEVWFDADGGLEHGDEWDAKIRRQIKECVLFIPVISANTQAREEGYFRIEWDLAAERARGIASGVAFILPVVIDDTREPDALVPDRFRAVQWTRLKGGEMSAEVMQRFLKLWSHRTGAVRAGDRALETGNGQAGANLPPVSRAASSISRWLAPTGIAVVVAIALLTWRPWQRASSTTTSHSKPEVAALLTRVRAVTAKTDAFRSDLDATVGLLEQAARLDATDAEVWAEWAGVDCRYASEYLDRSPARLDAARNHAAQAMRLNERSPAARLARAVSMVALNEDFATKQAAIAIVEPIVVEVPGDANALAYLAWLKTDPRQPEASFSLLERLERLPGRAGQAHFLRSTAYFWAHDFAHAAEANDRALAAERAAKFLLWKSYYLTIWQDDLPAAKRTIAELPAEMLSEEFPASARYFVALWARDYDQALAALRTVPRDYLNSGALSGPIGFYRGFALARAGRTAAAELEWRSGLDVVNRRLAAQARDRTTLEFKAILLKALGQAAEAEKMWQSARELFGETIDGWEDYFAAMQMLPEDAALDFLTKLMNEQRTNTMVLAANLHHDPFLDPLRNSPRFHALVARAEADPRLSPAAPKPERKIGLGERQ